MRPLLELFEGAKPYDRPALAERIELLAKSGAALPDGLPGRLLLDQPLLSLHPASWSVTPSIFPVLIFVALCLGPSDNTCLGGCITRGPAVCLLSMSIGRSALGRGMATPDCACV